MPILSELESLVWFLLMTFCMNPRFKGYKDHLELCIKDFKDVVDSIPPALRELFQNHIDKASLNFQAGLTTLAWNSMNIGLCIRIASFCCCKL